MNYHTVIGNIVEDGKVSPNGQFYEFKVADSPPPAKEGQEARYTAMFLRCSLYVGDGKREAPNFKKGQRVWVDGWMGLHEWTNKKDPTKKGVDLEMKVEKCGHMRGKKLQEIIDQDGASQDPDPGEAPVESKKAPKKAPGKKPF